MVFLTWVLSLCALPFSSPHHLTLPVSLSPAPSRPPSPCPPLSLCPSHPTASLPVSPGPWAGPSAGQGPGDDRLLPLAAARRGLRVAAVRGHCGCEWEEPWRTPCALGQLCAQVRVVRPPPSHEELRTPSRRIGQLFPPLGGSSQGGLLDKSRG